MTWHKQKQQKYGTCHQSHLFLPHQFLFFDASIVVPNFYASVPAYVRLCLCSFLCLSPYIVLQSPSRLFMLCLKLLAPLALLINNYWMVFCDIQNNQGRSNCYQLSQRPRLITLAATLIMQDITKK